MFLSRSLKQHGTVWSSGQTDRVVRQIIPKHTPHNSETRRHLKSKATPQRALTTDQQLADRFEAIELPRWRNDEAFRRLLGSFQAILPLRQPSDLTSAVMRRALLEHTEGVTVRLVRLIEALAVDAIRSGAEKIDQSSLSKLSSPLLLSMTEHVAATA